MTNLWMEFKDKMAPKELCKHIIDTYLVYGSLEKLEPIYGVTKPVLASFISKNEKELEPQLMKKYKKAKITNKTSSQIRKNKNEETTRKRLTTKILDKMPRVMEYKDFLDFVFQYDTGSLSGKKLVEIAASHGIKVIG